MFVGFLPYIRHCRCLWVFYLDQFTHLSLQVFARHLPWSAITRRARRRGEKGGRKKGWGERKRLFTQGRCWCWHQNPNDDQNSESYFLSAFSAWHQVRYLTAYWFWVSCDKRFTRFKNLSVMINIILHRTDAKHSLSGNWNRIIFCNWILLWLGWWLLLAWADFTTWHKVRGF